MVVTEADLVVVAVMREGGTEGDPEEEFSVVAGADSEVCSEMASGAVTGAGVVVVTEGKGSVACPVAVVRQQCQAVAVSESHQQTAR